MPVLGGCGRAGCWQDGDVLSGHPSPGVPYLGRSAHALSVQEGACFPAPLGGERHLSPRLCCAQHTHRRGSGWHGTRSVMSNLSFAAKVAQKGDIL